VRNIAERLRKNPNWTVASDPTYSGPYPCSLERMTDADFEVFQAEQAEWRRRLSPYLHSAQPKPMCEDEPDPRPRPQVRPALPFGQRIRDLRRALGWRQCDIAAQIGVSARSIIRYEQGCSSPIQIAPLRALRRLESAYSQELDARL
jgi:DNA-binding XRE family transcriptional regulator